MKIWIIIIAIAAVLGLVWAFLIEPKFLEVKKYRVAIVGLRKLRIVFASDLHIRPNQQQRLEDLLKKINELKPDLIFLGGDFVNGHKKSSSMPIEQIAQSLGKLEAKFGTYAVLGNHDWYYDGAQIAAELQKQQIVVLENSNQKLDLDGQTLYLAGVGDVITKHSKLKMALDQTAKPLILLSHSPDIFPQVPSSVDLTLAGHTHGGQVVFPFGKALVVPSKYGTRYACGLCEEDGRKMIVGRGIGTSLLPVRFNCRPEILLIEIE